MQARLFPLVLEGHLGWVHEAAKMAAITVETLLREADEIRQRAMESKQFSAASAAIKEKGILSGQRIERREIGAPGEFESLTDDELERAVVERFNALGLTPDAGSDTRHSSASDRSR